ncbi:MAG TPA: GAF domain-containing protein [Rhodocyclaceae bacterium]|nr:GAF domain-containing protein [Rhodocyclaceae bacterium]
MIHCVDSIRPCLEGVIPAFVATCALDGTPNIALASQLEYVDAQHVALSFQFFNKTRANILVHPYATVMVFNNETGESFRLSMQYLHTETEGRLFQRMKVKLAGIASHTGMADVFKLQGADVYRVLAVERVPGHALPAGPAARNLLPAMRAVSERLASAADLSSLFDETLKSLEQHFGFRHSMFLMLDESGKRLYTVASRGYAQSGVGSEITVGDGIIGVAAEHRTPIRIAHMTSEYSYALSLRARALEAGIAARAEIPFAGLPDSHSQLAVPILAADRLLGVLYLESPEQRRFSYNDEDALVAIAQQIGLMMRALQSVDTQEDALAISPAASQPGGGAPVSVRYFPENDIVFLADDYLIKGVAGAILWKLVKAHVDCGRVDFSNRELRLDPALRLPDIDDNLEARLILLSRRLKERCDFLGLEKTGRGRFRLRVERTLQLVSA